MNLRKEAKGRDCAIRIPGICNGNPETTVLAHLNNKRLFAIGTGQKVPDIFGSFSCNDCHDAVDSRSDYSGTDWNYLDIEKMFYEGVFRTQNILLQEGKIKCL